MKQTSLKWKIYLAFMTFSILLLLILWLFQVAFLDRFYKAIKINDVKRTASTIEKNINSESLDALIESLALSNDVFIEIIFEDLSTLSSSHTLQNFSNFTMLSYEKKQILENTWNQGGETLEYFSRDGLKAPPPTSDDYQNRPPPRPTDFQASILYTKIITNEKDESVALLINSLIVPVDATTNTLRVQLYYISGLMILFSVFLAFVIAKRIAAPIEKINLSAKSLAKGQYDIRFAGGGYKEINELADTLNHTATELSKVESLRQELIANITHDLRTPLTMISGYAEAMRDLPGEMNEENLNIIMEETKRLTTLVNDVLDLSKLQSGINQLSLDSFAFTETIAQTVSRLQSLLKNEGYLIDFSFDEAINLIADEVKIQQAFYNLLINAIHYTGSDKCIHVVQETTPDTVTLKIIDSGFGIEEKDLPYIWDRYYKSNQSHRRAVTGTGLGLSIVKSIISSHGGTYGVHSVPGEQSEFWFTLNRSTS
jgi:signal transduction histidine kinase